MQFQLPSLQFQTPPCYSAYCFSGTLTEMSLRMGGEGSGKLSQGRCSPPRSPGRNFKTMSALSPITLLELPLSSIQAIKRIKSGEYHKAMEIEALMSSNGMMLGF
uniref:Uncharacterized protein n=1 Tax=Aegilops tauschii subsp. strangulata TaxID=200361 RepID=A0A453STJ3_AEGTS